MIRRRSEPAGWPETIELVILAIHAGSTPRSAIAATAERLSMVTRVGGTTHVDDRIVRALTEVVRRVRRGDALADALAALPEHLGAIADELVDSIATAERYGLPLAPILDRLAAEARAERRRRAETEARSLPVRLAFPLVACTLPSFVLLAIVPALLGALSTLRDSVP